MNKPFDCPTIMWIPSAPKESAFLLSGDRTLKCKTRSIIHAYLLGHDPDLICMKYKIDYKEFVVAVLYELLERKRQIRDYESLRSDIVDWCELGVAQMRNHEPVSWPPPSIHTYKERQGRL